MKPAVAPGWVFGLSEGRLVQAGAAADRVRDGAAKCLGDRSYSVEVRLEVRDVRMVL